MKDNEREWCFYNDSDYESMRDNGIAVGVKRMSMGMRADDVT